MIDFSALGLTTAQTSHHGKRDKTGSSHEHGKDAKSFGDLVSQAGKKNGKKHAGDDDGASVITKHAAGKGHNGVDPTDVIDELEGAEIADLEAGQETGDDLLKTPTSNAGTAESESRVKLSAGFRQMLKSNAEGGVLRKADDSAKADKTDEKKTQNNRKDDVPAAKEKTAASPSEELHALLGMAPRTDDADDETIEKVADKHVAKASTHNADDDQATDAKSVKAEPAADAAGAGEKVDDAAAQQAAARHATVKASADLSADADDKNLPADRDVNKVHIVAADGKSQPADLDLAKSANAKSADDKNAASANNSKVDFVTVVDSRRYLGFSNDSNAAALTNAVKSDQSWAQVIHNVTTGANQTMTEVNTLKLQMNPEHLGNMTASLRLKGDELSVEVRVETVEAYRQLSNDQDGIVKALKDQGFSIDQVTIQLAPAARSDAGQGSSQNQQDGSGQNLQQGGQGDNARQREESARRNTNANNWTGNDKTSTFGDSGSSSDTSDSGNLYL